MNDEAELQVTLEPVGLDRASMDSFVASFGSREFVAQGDNGARIELLGVQQLDPDLVSFSKQTDASVAAGLRLSLYDYDRDRTVFVEGPVDADEPTTRVSGVQPLPDNDEFQQAVENVMQDTKIAAAVQAGLLTPYPPMPPLVVSGDVLERSGRVVTVGLLNTDSRTQHEIVGVDMTDGSIIRFPGGAPPTARATDDTCHPPGDANQLTVRRGEPGQARVVVSRAGTTLWEFVAIRPAVSSGTNGSGIELRRVSYRGDLVLHRAHVPILNVKYEDNACGPFRDWQYEEGMLLADPGSDPVPGFRVSPTPVRTIIETGTDIGNFLGVGVHIEGTEVVFTSEMHAAWYRYVSQWRFDADGTLRPRFGFDAVRNSCTCETHYHHVYWRFDFDIGTHQNNVVQEMNMNPLIGGRHWQTIDFESRRFRDTGRGRKWNVSNRQTGDGYLVLPGSNDSSSNDQSDAPFGRGDVWVVRFRPDEIDDGVVAIGPPYEAGIDQFVNFEGVDGQDVVVWYAGHFTHDESSGEEVSHIVGPDLIPTRNVGKIEAAQGHIELLRAHDIGTRYGHPSDQIDVDAVVQLRETGRMAYGFQLRDGSDSEAYASMFDQLRSAFVAKRLVRLEYIRTGNSTGEIVRVIENP